VQAEWEPGELIDAWTLTGGDWDLIATAGWWPRKMGQRPERLR
jgi:hypothetical protein